MEYEKLKQGQKETVDDDELPSPQSSLGCIEIQMLVMVFLSSIIIAVLSLFILQLYSIKENRCLTDKCTQQGSLRSSVMNYSASPCEDFYNYACGNFKYAHTPQPGVGKYSFWSAGRDRVLDVLYHQLTSNKQTIGVQRVSSAISKAKNYLDLCMTKDKHVERSMQSFFKLIEDVGGWSFTPHESSTGIPAAADDTYLADRLVKITNYGVSSIFKIDVVEDKFNNSQHMYLLGAPDGVFKGASKWFRDNTGTHRNFVDFCVTFFGLMGTEDSKELRQGIASLWEIEKQLMNFMDPANKQISQEHILAHKARYYISIGDFVEDLDTEMYGVTDSKFLFLLEKTLKYARILFKNDAISRDTIVFIKDVEFFKKLAKQILMKMSAGDKKVSDYVTFKFAVYVSEDISWAFDKALGILKKEVYGDSIMPLMWRRCTKQVDKTFTYVTAAVYGETVFDKKSRKKLAGLLEILKINLERKVYHNDWMDDETREIAKEKVRNIRYEIAYPDWIMDVKKLDGYYGDAHVVDDDFLASTLNMRKWLHQQVLAKYASSGGDDLLKSSDSLTRVHAQWRLSKGSLILQSGILQPPFFDEDFKGSFLYGGIGFIIAHELTHAFDQSGRLYNKDNNLDSWWSKEATDNYERKMKCYLDQYSKYSFKNVTYNSERTLSANMNDNGGMQFLYTAFFRWRKKHPTDEQLMPGLEKLNSFQQFFLAFTQLWCGHYTENYMQNLQSASVSSVFSERVLGVLSNTPEFATAFNCPLGSKYNPEKKCTMW